MSSKYTVIPGLSFPKGSDREYVEEWCSAPAPCVIRKTINGDEVVTNHNRCAFSISGSGDTLPQCDLKVGDVVSVMTSTKRSISLRFEKWHYKYLPWQFTYTWSYSFIEVEQ